MADTGWVSPGAAANIAAPGADWANPTNIFSDDTTNASSGGTAQGTDFLAATSFPTSVPTGSTINGIEVWLNDWTGTGGNNLDSCSLTKDGSTSVGSPLTPTRTVGNQFLGGASELWGASWTRDEVTSANFGVLSVAGDDNVAFTITVDYIAVKVYYTEAPPPPPPTYRLSAQRRGR